MGTWSNVWRTKAKDWLFGRIETPDEEPKRIVPRETYLSVMIRQMRIVDVRVGFSRFYGTVQSYARLPHLSGKAVEFTTVTTPSHLKNVQKKHLDYFVLGDQRVLGPVPYMGGDLELEMGLFSVKSQDMLQPFLEILEDLSKAAGVGIVSVAAPYIAPLKKGVELLTGGDSDALLEIGLAVTIDVPVEGTYFVARIDRSDQDPNGFSIDGNNRLRDEHGKHVTDAPYIVFSVQQSPVRDDWFTIPAIADAYSRLMSSIEDQSSFKLVDSHREHLARVVHANPDILPGHADQIDEWVSSQVAKALGAVKTGRQDNGPRLPSLKSMPMLPVQSS